jgi:glutamate synthase domain-containing protein 1
MYHFAVVALMGLAVLKLADLLEELVPSLGRARTLLPFTLALAATVALDYSMFRGFGVELRETWMGPWATGVIVGALAGAWSAVLGWFGTDRIETSDGRTGQARRIAA